MALFLRTTSATIALSPLGVDWYLRVCPIRWTMFLARSFFRSEAARRGAYSDSLWLLSSRTWRANSEAVKPWDSDGDTQSAMSASATHRMRALFRSIPPTLVLPTDDGA